MLVPAAILVLIVLGAIAVDSAVVFLAQRDLANRTAGAANDIAGIAVSDEQFYDGGAIALDSARAEAYVGLAFAPARRPSSFSSWTATATTDGNHVVVEAEADVRLVFAPAIPGVHRSVSVRSRSLASAREG